MPRLQRALCQKRSLAALLIALLTLLALSPSGASAHPLGNFTVNQYARLELTTGGPRIVYILDLAEVPALQEIQRIDLNHDGSVDDAEAAPFLSAALPEIAHALTLTIDGAAIPLLASESTLAFPDGQAGLKLLRLRAVFTPAASLAWTGDPQSIALTNSYQTDRLGWRELLVTHGAGITLTGVAAPETDASHELTAYPSDLLASPLDQTAAFFTLQLTPGSLAALGFTTFAESNPVPIDASARPNGGSTGGRFAALLNGDDLSSGGIILSLLLAMLWGAAHALSPGHGKTIVGAYLVGSRGTPRHAAFLGLTVTVTHTAGVIALGLITLFASRYIVPETLFPWLSVASGALVVLMGLWTLRQRLSGDGGHHHHHHTHDHDHDHDHPHTHGGFTHTHGGSTHSHVPPGKPSWRGLLALGVSGGLIPCPSALLVLLGSVALGRVGFGLALVIAFSLGLAATLTGLGILFLYAGRLIERRMSPVGPIGKLLRFAPAAGSAALTLAGIAIIVRAISETTLR